MENLSRFTFNTNPVKELLENTIDMQDAVVGMQGCVGNVTAALAEGAAYAVQYGALCLSQIVNEMNQKGISSNTLTQLNAKYQEMQAQVSNMNQQFQATTESGSC